MQPEEQEGARHQDAPEPGAAGPAAPDPPGRDEEGDREEERAQADPHQEADLGGGVQGQRHRADGQHQQERQGGALEGAGQRLFRGRLIGAEEQPADLPVAGGDREQRGRQAGRRVGRHLRREILRDRPGEQPDTERPPAPRPRQQIVPLIQAMETHQDHRQDDGTDGLCDVACENHKRRIDHAGRIL